MNPEIGRFNWTSLSSPDSNTSKDFYTKCFGWTYETSEQENTTLALCNGVPIGSISKIPNEANFPAHWICYVDTKNIAETLSKWTQAGGKVLLDETNIGDSIKYALGADPNNTALGVRQLTKSSKIAKDIHGSMCWVELLTRQAEDAKAFYKTIFEWTTSATSRPFSADIRFTLDGKSVAGLVPYSNDVPSHSPSMWLPYFQVDSCLNTGAQIETAGGQTLTGIIPVPEIGEFGVFQDPHGAIFGIAEFH